MGERYLIELDILDLLNLDGGDPRLVERLRINVSDITRNAILDVIRERILASGEPHLPITERREKRSGD